MAKQMIWAASLLGVCLLTGCGGVQLSPSFNPAMLLLADDETESKKGQAHSELEPVRKGASPAAPLSASPSNTPAASSERELTYFVNLPEGGED